MKKITKQTTIGDAVQAAPEEVGKVFAEHGLHCIGCHVSPYETIEQGARGHGIDDETIDKMVDEINKAISKSKKKEE